jgi:hypothetical protein
MVSPEHIEHGIWAHVEHDMAHIKAMFDSNRQHRIWDALSGKIGDEWQKLDMHSRNDIMNEFLDAIYTRITNRFTEFESEQYKEGRDAMIDKVLNEELPRILDIFVAQRKEEPSFPSLKEWVNANSSNLPNTTPKEQETLYAIAKQKFESQKPKS